MKIPDSILDAVDWKKVPQPILWLIIAIFLVVAWKGRHHLFSETTAIDASQETVLESGNNLATITINVVEEETQKPISGAQVIIEVSEGSDTNTTDNLGFYKASIPATESLRVRVLKDGYYPYDQNLDLRINPEQPKRIVLKSAK